MIVCDCVEGCQLADQFTPATREIMVFTKSAKRYFDLDAVREPVQHPHQRLPSKTPDRGMKYVGDRIPLGPYDASTSAGAPPLDWWNLPWDRVADRLVRAMVPERVCKICGKPSRRITDVSYSHDAGANGKFPGDEAYAKQTSRGVYGAASIMPHGRALKNVETLGFSDCGHDDWRPGVVFDPFPLVEGEQMPATFYVGDAIEVMGKLPEKSVDLILTSPPFLALRSYLPADHPDKALEGGSQSTPGEYVDWLLDVVEACDRVLAPHGSLVFELGDTYAGSGGAGEDYQPGGWREDQNPFGGSANRVGTERDPDGFSGRRGHGAYGGSGWPLAKSLSLIPESFRFAMVYGRNPHTGRRTAPWRLRNVIRWVRPNPPVGALGDKFRPATSELMVFCKSAKRYFDLDAVREPYAASTVERGDGGSTGMTDNGRGVTTDVGRRLAERKMTQSGAPPLDWWNIPLTGEPCQTCEGVGFIWTDREHSEQGKATCPVCKGSGMEGTERYGPKPRGGNRPATGAPKEQQVSNDQRQVRSERREPGDTEGIIWTNAAMANRTYHKDGGAPPLDWWNIPPGGYEGAHYAVWPPELCVKPVKAMCPEKVCRQCGEPSRRITDVSYEAHGVPALQHAEAKAGSRGQAVDKLALREQNAQAMANGRATKNVDTLGFSDCGHDDWRPGVVLDPFAGSGTTLAVATGHGRDAIGIDLDERNFELALQRVGPFILSRAESV